jgi:hypothetical protein
MTIIFEKLQPGVKLEPHHRWRSTKFSQEAWPMAIIFLHKNMYFLLLKDNFLTYLQALKIQFRRYYFNYVMQVFVITFMLGFISYATFFIRITEFDSR